MADFILRPAHDGDLEILRDISARARARYAVLPVLAHVTRSPPLDRARFAACRVIVAVNAHDGLVAGFSMTRPLDGLLYLDNISVDVGQSGRGIGNGLLANVFAQGEALRVPAVALTTFREPLWNGPWFRRHGFRPMPDGDIGPGLRGVMERQAGTLDPRTRETLWRPCDDGAWTPGGA